MAAAEGADDGGPGQPPPGPTPTGDEDEAAGPFLSQGRVVSRVRAGGRVTAVRLREDVGGYAVAVEVGWNPGVRYTVTTYARAVKSYRSASLAIGMVRSSYRYRGEIVVEAVPDRDDDVAVGGGWRERRGDAPPHGGDPGPTPSPPRPVVVNTRRA